MFAVLCVFEIYGAFKLCFSEIQRNNLLHSLGIIANIGFKVNDVKTKEAEKNEEMISSHIICRKLRIVHVYM